MKDILQVLIIFATSGWLISMSFIMVTKNITSAIIFKVIPFFLGLGCLFVALRMVGVIP